MTTLKSRIPDPSGPMRFVKKKQEQLREALEVGARAAADAGAHRLTDGPATGRYYRSRKESGPVMITFSSGRSSAFTLMHRAAKEGESPHEDTGETRKAIHVFLEENRGARPLTATGWSGIPAQYMRAQNDGSANGRIPPHPIMPYMLEAGADAIRKYLSGYGSVHGKSGRASFLFSRRGRCGHPGIGVVYAGCLSYRRERMMQSPSIRKLAVPRSTMSPAFSVPKRSQWISRAICCSMRNSSKRALSTVISMGHCPESARAARRRARSFSVAVN
jgi:hypothetical protein